MRSHKVLLVFKKDWREIRRNWQVLLPVIIIPLMFSVILPVALAVIPSIATSVSPSSLQGLDAIVKNLPSDVQNELVGMTDQQVTLYVIGSYFFAPFFLIIPLMASSVIASDSFAGEKERKTIEALLAAPVSDSELFLGKILVSFIPSMIITVASFIIYSAIIDVVSFTMLGGRLLMPNLVWIMLIFGVAPTLALAGIGLTVMISARVKGFREAQQLSAILVVPVIMLVFGQVSGAIFFGPSLVGLLVAIFAVIDLAVFLTGVRMFRREEILSRLT